MIVTSAGNIARASYTGTSAIAFRATEPLTMPEVKSIVFVVDDDISVRESLELLIESAGWQPKTFASAQEFLARPQPTVPCCLVLDVTLPGLNGLELQQQLAGRTDMPIIFITGHGDVPMAVNAFRKGAVDFVEKPFNDEEFLARIENAVKLNGPAFQDRARQLSAAVRLATLTRREREVMEHIVAGQSNKLMADALHISIKTVEAHRARVMDKMRANSVAELVQLVLEAQHAVLPARNS